MSRRAFCGGRILTGCQPLALLPKMSNDAVADRSCLLSSLRSQPKQITDIKSFLEIARRKDASGE